MHSASQGKKQLLGFYSVLECISSKMPGLAALAPSTSVIDVARPAIAQLDFGKQHYIDVVDMDDMDMHGISVGVGVGVVAGVAVGMLDGYG